MHACAQAFRAGFPCSRSNPLAALKSLLGVRMCASTRRSTMPLVAGGDRDKFEDLL